mgnify:CR=1 FL=1
MTGKKVRVFWPVDSQWYIADVQQYDANTGEHLLRYPDGDTEWVRIGEDHTTNAQYKEYFSSLKNGGDGAAVAEGKLTRLPSLGNGVSFALSAMSQSFGLHTNADDETTARLKTGPSHQQQRLFQQLNLDRTASSMSSFGMYPGGRQLSFTHSFSSKIGTVPSLDDPYAHAPQPGQQQRQEGSQANFSATSPGTRDAPPPGNYPWPHNQYPNPNYYGGSQQMMYGYPGQPAPVAYGSNEEQNAQPTSAASSKPSSKGTKKDKKALATAWLKAEDEHLLDLVLQMKHPLKWSLIAQSLAEFSKANDIKTPERTGKQCRERYVNHLNPRLKHTEFTPLEDATIWRLYATIGTQWAKMSKVIPGRTDNNLKNRFHNLKRQLIREEESRVRAPLPEGFEYSVHSDRIREVPPALRTKIEEMWNHQRNIGVIAANTIQAESREDDMMEREGFESSLIGTDGHKHRKFGPFETVTEPIQCGRCGLFMPSVQCGNEMCTKTKWCKVCTKVSMHLGGNVLRECVNLRKCQDRDLVRGVDRMMTEVWNES